MSTLVRRLSSLALVLLLGPLARAQTQGDSFDDGAPLELPLDRLGDADVGAVISRWAGHLEALAVVAPGVREVRLHLRSRPGPLTWPVVKELLDLNDVVVVESRPVADGPWVIRVRDRLERSGREPLPPRPEGVSALFRIRHGATREIRAILAELCRRESAVAQPEDDLLLVVGPLDRVLAAERLVRRWDVPGGYEPGRNLQDEAWDTFGTGSGDPFRDH